MKGTPTENFLHKLPLQKDTIETVECKQENGVLVCQVGLTDKHKLVVLSNSPDVENVKCTKVDGGLSCEAVLSDTKERVRITIPNP